jgi:nicotinate-nucleotide adenylyltransferase
MSTIDSRTSDIDHRPSAIDRLAILGGTLDPVHCGHIAAATAVRDTLGIPRVLVLPSNVPPHRPVQPLASSFHRFAMAALAVSGVPALAASDDELRSEGLSYTADTLERLLDGGMTASQIFFITGADAFAEIATWKRYPDVLDLANFVVVSRSGSSIDDLAARLPTLAARMRWASREPSDSASRLIYLVKAPTPDVSSTIIRARLARGESIHGLVPALVETHIHQHGLYLAAAAANQLHGKD